MLLVTTRRWFEQRRPWVRRRAAARRVVGVDPLPPVLTAWLSEQLVLTGALGTDLRRIARTAPAAERAVLEQVRRAVVTDRAALRSLAGHLGAPSDWTARSQAVVGSWVSARTAELLPLVHRLPVLERLPVPQRLLDPRVRALLELETVAAGLRRRAAVWRELVVLSESSTRVGLRTLLQPAGSFAATATAQAEKVEDLVARRLVGLADDVDEDEPA